MQVDDVKRLIDQVGPHIDARYDHTYAPDFPIGRGDVCAVNRMVENGNDYGYNVLYLVWEAGGQLQYRKITDTSATKDYLAVDSIREEKGDVVVEYGSGGSFSGEAWSREFRVKKSELGLV